MVWTMSDLAGTTVTMLLFADAYDGHKLVCVARAYGARVPWVVTLHVRWRFAQDSEKGVYAIMSPRVLPSREGNGSFSLSANRRGDITMLGVLERLVRVV